MTTKNATSKRAASPKQPSTARKDTAAAAEKPVKKGKKAKGADSKNGNKEKVIRDSFTMPQGDYAKIDELKKVCLDAGMHVKKSELLRAGLHALVKLDAAQLKRTITQMEQVKTGRPKKSPRVKEE